MAIYRGPGGSGDATTDAASQSSVATNKAAEAAISASAAASSATSADNSATASSNSASNAATSETNAQTAETNAETAETNAATSAAESAASYDSFDDRYLGAKSSDPTLNNDGDALSAGALYFNTVSNLVLSYTGSIWQAISTGVGLQVINNLSDVNSAATSRTNLGVAIGTDVQAFSSVLAATTASYTTAEESKLAGIETSADVTDATNVTTAGALMDSELTSITSVKALNQGVATTDSPSFSGLTVDTDTLFVDSSLNRVGIGTSSPVGNLHVFNNGINGGQLHITNTTTGSTYNDGAVFGYDSSNDLVIINHEATNTKFYTDLTERVRIDSSGNVGIGTNSPAQVLDVIGNIAVSGTVDGRDVATDGTKLDGIETSADVTDATNVTVAGALMDSEVTNLAQVKAFDTTDYATAAQGTLAASALQSADIGSSVQAFDADTLKADTADTLTAPFRGTVTADNDLSFDLNVTNNFSCTPSGAGTLTFTNHTAGQSGFIWLDNSGGHAIAAAATTKINAADLTAISTAGVFTLSYFDNGTNAYVSASRSFG